MKKILIIGLALAAFGFTSCEYDNYEAPSLVISGNMVYEGENLPFDGNPARTVLRVVQSGFGKVDAGTAIQVAADGSFTQLLFGGKYSLTPYNNPYPFVFPDYPYMGESEGYPTTDIDLQTNLRMDIEVIPYYVLSEFKAWYEDGQIKMSCQIATVNDEGGLVTDANRPALAKVRAYVSTSRIVNSATTCTKTWSGWLPNYQGESTMDIPVKDYQTGYTNNYRSYAYCRMAIELGNIPDYYLFTPVVKVEGLPVKEWNN